MRREFMLPEADEIMLTAQGLSWETVSSGGQWVLLHEFPLPPGYNVSQADVAISISAGYPDAGLDMVYFFPPLARADGKFINNLALMIIDNRTWQRWSRHRTPQNPWRPGMDDLSTHLGLVEDWLVREFNLR